MSDAGLPDRQAIEAAQLEALRLLIGKLVPDNRFYTPALRAAGLACEPESLAAFVARMPFTTKQELLDDQRFSPPYGTNLTFPLERYTRYNQTSGTSGTPLRWLDTPESWDWMVENWMEVFRAAGVGPGDRIFFAFSFGPFLGFWTAFGASERIGCLSLPGGGMSSAARLQTLLENRATVLCCTPTYAIRLGEVAREEGIDLRSGAVRALLVAGEPGGGIASVRARIEHLWPGARLYDHHGMTEVGPVSLPCPARPGVLHILEPAFLPEVVDPRTGHAAPPATEGELVLTNLGREGSPLLRYRTGDLVRTAAETKCLCGRSTLALEGGILGRTDEMVVVRGVNLYPSALEAIVRRFPEVAEFRVTLHAEGPMPEITVELEPVPGLADSAALCREVETALRAAFQLRIPVTGTAPGALPRFELKARRWERRTSAGPAGAPACVATAPTPRF